MTTSLSDLREQVRELCASWRAEGRYRPSPDSWLRSFDLSFSKELARRGWIGMTWPREFGGGEQSNLARLVVTEELLRAGAPVAAHWIGDRQIGPAILRHGSPQLQHEVLPGITAGDHVFCLGMSEPESGSDWLRCGPRPSGSRVVGPSPVARSGPATPTGPRTRTCWPGPPSRRRSTRA